MEQDFKKVTSSPPRDPLNQGLQLHSESGFQRGGHEGGLQRGNNCLYDDNGMPVLASAENKGAFLLNVNGGDKLFYSNDNINRQTSSSSAQNNSNLIGNN